MKIRGRVISGSGKGRSFTELEWVKKQFLDILGFEPVPGTLNLLLEETTNQLIIEFRQDRAYYVIPPGDDFCRGVLLRAIIGDLKGAIIVPQVPNYDVHLLEILAPVNLRKRFRLKDGDEVEVKI
jgi:CTP-dependent riboflavin kinase